MWSSIDTIRVAMTRLIWGLCLVTVPLLAQSGQRLFEAQCALCHGQTGGGGRGPSLLRPVLAKAPDDAALEKVIAEGIQPEMPGAWQLSPKEVKAVASYVRSIGRVTRQFVPGDREHGRELYVKNGCGGCHIVLGEGSGFGSELSNIGARRNADHLRRAIIEPETDLPEGFLMFVVTPKTGAKVTGIRVGEDPFSVQLIDAGGRFHSFRKAEVTQLDRQAKRSPMPAYKLSGGDLQDLVAYLASLTGDSGK